MMKKFMMDKKVGETPLQALERGRKNRRIPSSVPMAYAGRLDPMASGKLLILVGDECKRQKDYHALNKEYEIEILLGISSDTGDILGMTETHSLTLPTTSEIRNVIASFVGPYTSPYPRFSSKTVDGKPLFQWTLEEENVEVPLQNGTIHSIAHKGIRAVSSDWLRRYVMNKIATLTPVTEESKALGRDFRKEEVREVWEKILATPAKYSVLKLRVRTSAGVYMRTLAQDIGNKLDTGALALSIRRTKILG